MKSVGLLKRKFNMESGSKSLQRKETSTKQTVCYGNIHEPESCGNHSIGGRSLVAAEKNKNTDVYWGEEELPKFESCIYDGMRSTAPATCEYKLLQLRECLSREALGVIENLGHSSTVYEAAKERLERRYGGKLQQVTIYLEDLDKFQQIRAGNAQDLEQFADLLEITIINLKETGYHNEPGNGFL